MPEPLAVTRPGNPDDDPSRKVRCRRVARALARLYPDADCALAHRSPFELIVATILSAQCTDKMVNRVTPALFDRFPDADALADAEPEELESLIRPTGFYRAKARNLIGMARGLVERHGGQVPRDLRDLTSLPGVGRKTAHVVRGVAMGLASGVVVDTHVKRLSYRLGLTEATDPVLIERDLNAGLPRSGYIAFSHRMIAHGRQICGAARPRCDACGLLKLCPRRGLTG